MNFSRKAGSFMACLPLLSALPAFSTADTPEAVEEVTVIGTNPDRYRDTTTRSVSGIALEFMELPRMVEVIPEQLLLDQKVTELEEGLRNVPGISLSDGFGGSNNDFLIRGFRRNTIYRNGLRVDSNFRVNTANLEKISVVKGPASITYGQVEPGGLVDITTKKPLLERRVYGEARVGSYDSQFLLADWSEPLGEKTAIRINASSESSDTFRDFFTVDRKTASITGRYNVTEQTALTAEYEYRDEFRSFDRGTVTVPTADGREIINTVMDIDIATRFGEAFEEIDTRFEFASLGLQHDFTEVWTLNVQGAWEYSLSNDYQARPRALLIFDENALINDEGIIIGAPSPKDYFASATDRVFLARRSDGSRERDKDASYIQALLNGEFTTGAIDHRIVIGADYRSAREARFFVVSPTTDGVALADGGNGPLLNLARPIYGNLEKDVSLEGLSPIEAESREQGIFINDYLDITEKLSLMMGARLDTVDADGDGPADDVSEVSPQLALNCKLSSAVSLFTSYAEAFEPNTAFVEDANGIPSEHTLYDPEDATQYEAGAKMQLFAGRLKIATSLYDITKSNVLTDLDGTPQLVDGQTSQGLEFSIGGQPLPGLNLVSGYAYTDASIESGPNAGKRPRNVAEHTANFWASYEAQQGALQGMGAGLGIFYMDNRYGDDANSWELGSYTLLDASFWYNLSLGFASADNIIRFQLAVKNLTDEEYYPASGGDLRVSIGAPRSVVGSVSMTF